jgi:hypothetical protein
LQAEDVRFLVVGRLLCLPSSRNIWIVNERSLARFSTAG